MSQAIGARPQRARAFKPDSPIAASPVFAWPPRAGRLLRWLFGFPGYLWPCNTAYFAIALATWLWLTPAMATMRHLAPGWIAFLLVRNALLLAAVVGAWHLRLYTFRAQDLRYKYSGRWPGTSDTQFLFGSQLRENLFWTFASAVPVWTAYEAITLWMQANHWIPTVTWRAHPIYCAVIVLLLPLFREVHFYLVHRLIHVPVLYRWVHKLHHNNVNPTPWSGMSMHPVEHLLYFSGVLVHWLLPSNPLHVIYHVQHLSFAPATGHSGFHKVELAGARSLDADSYMHYLHHRYFEVNYGDFLIPLDRWFGTLHDGSDEAQQRMNERLRQRQVAP